MVGLTVHYKWASICKSNTCLKGVSAMKQMVGFQEQKASLTRGSYGVSGKSLAAFWRLCKAVLWGKESVRAWWWSNKLYSGKTLRQQENQAQRPCSANLLKRLGKGREGPGPGWEQRGDGELNGECLVEFCTHLAFSFKWGKPPATESSEQGTDMTQVWFQCKVPLSRCLSTVPVSAKAGAGSEESEAFTK